MGISLKKSEDFKKLKQYWENVRNLLNIILLLNLTKFLQV